MILEITGTLLLTAGAGVWIGAIVFQSAVVAGALFLNEALSSWAYAGLALILSGIALSEAGPGVTRLRRRLDRLAAAHADGAHQPRTALHGTADTVTDAPVPLQK